MTELTISANEITEALRKHVTEFNPAVGAEQVGRVVEVGDGIARVSGLPSAKVNELLEFEDGTLGLAMNLDEDTIGAVVLGSVDTIEEEQVVRATGRILNMPVGDGLLGRVVNAIGAPTGIWAVAMLLMGRHVMPTWTLWLAAINLTALAISLSFLYARTWARTKLVLPSTRERLWYMLRINPVSAMLWWVIWLIPLAIGLWMFLRDEGQVWERTEKIDANRVLVESAGATSIHSPQT